MSNRIFEPFRLCLLIAICLLAVFTITTAFERPAQTTPHKPKLHVSDHPIVSTLDDYYTLINEGQVVISMDGEKHVIYWDDFSLMEKRRLQLMLRTP